MTSYLRVLIIIIKQLRLTTQEKETMVRQKIDNKINQEQRESRDLFSVFIRSELVVR